MENKQLIEYAKEFLKACIKDDFIDKTYFYLKIKRIMDNGKNNNRK